MVLPDSRNKETAQPSGPRRAIRREGRLRRRFEVQALILMITANTPSKKFLAAPALVFHEVCVPPLKRMQGEIERVARANEWRLLSGQCLAVDLRNLRFLTRCRP